MRLLSLVATVFLLGTATEYRRPRENQFQIQGVIIEDPPRIYRYKRQLNQPFYRQSAEKEQEMPPEGSEDMSQPPPPYLERPSSPSYFQRPLPPAPSNFGSNFRQPLSPSQQTFQRAPSPQPQFQRPPQSPPRFQSQPPPQLQYRPPQPQSAYYPPQSWSSQRRVFSEINNFAQEPSRNNYNTEVNTQGNQGGAVEFDGGEYSGARYYYPPKQPFPLPKCFHNPTGYVCCNQLLNDLIVDTYTELEKRPKFHTCNVNALAYHIQQKAERRFNQTFETIAAYDDFAQKIHFHGDFVCKVELGGKYMLAYATVSQAMENTLRPLPSHRSMAHLDSPHLHLNRRSNVMRI